jgi:hypothetical protein
MKEFYLGLKIVFLLEGMKNSKTLMTLRDFHWGGYLLMLLDNRHIKHNN